MDEPTFAVADLTYPGARLLDETAFGNVRNVLFATRDDLGKVWRWYSRRLGTGVSPIGTGEREFDGGKVQIAFRRTNRAVSRDAPFADTEHPQALTVQQGTRAVTVILSRNPQSSETTITLFVFG